MDAISEMIGAIHAGAAYAHRVRESGAWGSRLPGTAGMGFHVVLQGTGWLITDTERPIAIRAGDLVLVPSGAEHGLSHTDDAKIGLLPELQLPSPDPAESGDFDFILGCYRLPRGQAGRPRRDLPPVLTVSPDYDSHPELRALIEVLKADVSHSLPGTAATRPALVDLMLVHALRHGQQKLRTEDWPAVADPGIAAALKEIYTHPHLPWSVWQLAEIAGMSRPVFVRRFTAAVDKPPMAYLIAYRLRLGARLLRETKAPLATIARQVGYSSEYAFSNAFRREYGIAPGRFRAELAAR